MAASVFVELAERFAHEQPQVKAESSPGPDLNDLLLASSRAMDLLEGRSIRTALRVAVIAGSIASHLKLPERTRAGVVYAALLHDVGLARLSCEIHPHLPPGVTEKQLYQIHALLNARVIGSPHEAPLSPQLLHLLQQHPQAARGFLEQCHLSEDVIEIVVHHHELMDGSGYPFGLSGEQIPMGARILAFADVVEGVIADTYLNTSGLTSRRHALENFLEIKTAGKFDPDVVGAFRFMIDEYDDFLKSLSGLQVDTMIRKLMPERRLKTGGDLLLSVVEAMGALSDSLLPAHKAGRSKHVAVIATRLAEAIGIHRAQLGELAVAAMLMDIGHLATPIGLLVKPGPLVAHERAIVQDHVLQTMEVLKDIPGFESLALWAFEAHERMNGKGYPAGKKGFDISVGGRILALADVFDAITHGRPHRNHSHDTLDALPVIAQGRQSLYDSQLVSLLRKVVLNTELPVPVY